MSVLRQLLLEARKSARHLAALTTAHWLLYLARRNLRLQHEFIESMHSSIDDATRALPWLEHTVRDRSSALDRVRCDGRWPVDHITAQPNMGHNNR